MHKYLVLGKARHLTYWYDSSKQMVRTQALLLLCSLNVIYNLPIFILFQEKVSHLKDDVIKFFLLRDFIIIRKSHEIWMLSFPHSKMAVNLLTDKWTPVYRQCTVDDGVEKYIFSIGFFGFNLIFGWNWKCKIFF